MFASPAFPESGQQHSEIILRPCLIDDFRTEKSETLIVCKPDVGVSGENDPSRKAGTKSVSTYSGLVHVAVPTGIECSSSPLPLRIHTSN